MKNLVFAFLAVLLIQLNGYSQEVKEVSVQATFEIGRNSKNCKQFGICTKKKVTIKFTIKLEDKNEEQSKNAIADNEFVTIFNKQKDGSVRFYLSAETVDFIKGYMQSDVFIMEEDYLLNQKEIDLTNYNLKAGKYEYNFDSELKLFYLVF